MISSPSLIGRRHSGHSPLYLARTLVCSIRNTLEINDGLFLISTIELIIGELDENCLIIVVF